MLASNVRKCCFHPQAALDALRLELALLTNRKPAARPAGVQHSHHVIEEEGGVQAAPGDGRGDEAGPGGGSTGEQQGSSSQATPLGGGGSGQDSYLLALLQDMVAEKATKVGNACCRPCSRSDSSCACPGTRGPQSLSPDHCCAVLGPDCGLSCQWLLLLLLLQLFK